MIFEDELIRKFVEFVDEKFAKKNLQSFEISIYSGSRVNENFPRQRLILNQDLL